MIRPYHPADHEDDDERNYPTPELALKDREGYPFASNRFKRESSMFQSPQAKTDPRLSGIPADEPIFVLRASDIFAPVLVRMWAQTMQLNPAISIDAIKMAYGIAQQMEDWPSRQWPIGLLSTKPSEMP